MVDIHEDLRALAVRDAAADGDLATAGRLAYDLDTCVRDQVPTRQFLQILRAADLIA